MSPDRAKVLMQQRVIKPTLKKVQVVYYLSRNGHLEHPHYMEVTHLANQQLRLKDVMERLTVLRGKGVPSLYSWSCKRSYRNGYVWNDLGENDIIYPCEGAEYVLKGSELIEGCTEKVQHLQVVNGLQFQQDTNLQPKHKSLASKRHLEAEELVNNQYRGEEDEEEEEEEEEYEEKTSYTSSTTPLSRCSRGVSTDEIDELQQQETNKNTRTELKHNYSVSPPPSNTSKVFEDCDLVANKPLLTRNSMLLSLIACGGSGSFRKSAPVGIAKQPPQGTVARNGGGGGGLHKGVVCKAAAKVAVEEDEMISCMSENPRFGNLQSEEKEYFSGSIVESMSTEERIQVEPGLKKSSSHNEERSSMVGLGEAAEEESRKDNSSKGKCIPMKKFSSKKSNK
ncbi:Protein UPSTREAM OF FLC [Abeliophyllum distichum]|uniref:Protein UPSTREAM OF FLC n=1 Tax=Abeliophyllum distichum TaxID=126358 RepID=A0ABD1V221_9LAMI